MDNLTFKIQTQNGLILQSMLKYPNRWFLCSDFCGGDSKLPFLGYKAPTRIAEMQKQGILVSRWSDRTTALGTKLKEYTLAPEFRLIITGEEIEVTREKFQSSLF